MSISFYCRCGKKLKAKAAQAGQRGQCTACGRALTIPAASSAAPLVAPPSLEASWYFSHDGRMFGPLGVGDLRELAGGGQLSPTDPVLRPGAAEWEPARAVVELFPPVALAVAPVVVPAAPVKEEPPRPSSFGLQFASRHHVLAEAQVVPDASRCVQCGICTHNCPMGIDVRAHARRGESEAWRIPVRAAAVCRRDDVNSVRLMVAERSIAGALVMGDQTWSRPLQRLIVEQVDVSSIRSTLVGGAADALDHLGDFYRRWERSRAS